jgi:hypothetical protein
MLKNVIESLSDTELSAIATESNETPIRQIFEQLSAKNDGEPLVPFSRWELTSAVIGELARRLLQRDLNVN